MDRYGFGWGRDRNVGRGREGGMEVWIGLGEGRVYGMETETQRENNYYMNIDEAREREERK